MLLAKRLGKGRARRQPSSGRSARRRLSSGFEPLEKRFLLSIDGPLPVSIYTAGDSAVAPIWFADYSDADTPSHVNSPTLAADVASDDSNVWLATGNQYDWIVRFDTGSLGGINSVAQTESLLVGSGVEFEVIRGLGLVGQVMIRSDGASLKSAQQWLADNPYVASHELDFNREVQLTPNDRYAWTLWGMNNTGQTGGTDDADIDAAEAWEITTGTSDVVVGVIDTGVDYTHVDLRDNIWTNPGEIAGNGIDDDNNGFVDDVHGYDFVNNDGDPMDDHYHGTHCAGTIAGRGNNGTGVAGVNWSASIMGLKFLNAQGSGSTSDAVRAVNYATMMRTQYDVNIRITSNSWGGGGYSSSLYDAIQAHNEAGILFIAAAGNSAGNNDYSPHYPANYNLPGVISVAATDYNDNLAGFSCYGVGSVDLAAPGVDIYSTIPNDGYRVLSGTSMATPHVSGVAALAWSVAPDATIAQVRAAIMQGVDPLDSLAGKVGTGGRLNALNTLELVESGVPYISGLVASPNSVARGDNVTLTAQQVTDTDGSIRVVRFYRDSNGNSQLDDGDQLMGSDDEVANEGNVGITISTNGLGAGIHLFFAVAQDNELQWSDAAVATVIVRMPDLHGDNPAGATLVSAGSSTNGEIQTSEDVDWFKFQATAGQTYRVYTELCGLSDSVLYLYDQDGTTRLAYNDDVSWPEDPSSIIEWQAPESGIYYVKVDNYWAETGAYRLHVEGDVVTTDLGAVDFQEIAGLDLTTGDYWYVLETSRDGFLTIEALFENSADEVQVTLYDSGRGTLATSSSADGGQRLDWQVGGGQTYYFSVSGNAGDVDLRLANLVQQDGAAVAVYGTNGNDQFSFAAASRHRVTVNGVHYQFQASEVTSVAFNGQAGDDRAVLVGSSGNDNLVMRPTSAELSGSGYEVAVANTTTIFVIGQGGEDVANLYDSAGDDVFLATPDYARLYGNGFFNQVKHFRYVHARATAGGTDVAKLYDSAGNDTFVAGPTYGQLSGNGFYNRALNFRYVHAFSNAGGTDVAKLYDSAGNDVFLARPTHGQLQGVGFYNRALNFRYVHAFSNAGGTDFAKLYDSAGDDVFVAQPGNGQLYGAGFHNRAVDFRYVRAFATSGGTDVAKLYDSAGNDVFVAGPNYGQLYGNGFNNRAEHFRYVHAFSNAGGTDVAKLYDSPGDDLFLAAPTHGQLQGAGFYNRAVNFRYVHAFSSAGGSDVAKLYDSAGDDVFLAKPTHAQLYGAGFYNRALNFRYVHAYANEGGYDRAHLYDSSGDDRLDASGSTAKLSHADMAAWAHDFKWVKSISNSGGNDTKHAEATDFLLVTEGDWFNI